jgi:hypothetical protein
MQGELDRGAGYAVFAQRSDARVEIDAWCAHAQRFFAARIGLASGAPAGTRARVAAARFVVAPDRGEAGIRAAFARPASEEDWAAAEAAEARAGASGLARLARRCATVWIVATEGADDALALRVAAVLASVLLGPILSANGEIFGVKTARARLGD